MACGGYDTRERRWRHLDTCQYQTWLVAQVPRVRCPEHGVRRLAVPWAESNSRLTALTRSRYLWLQHSERMSASRWDTLQALRAANLKTGRAWAIKKHAMCLWQYKRRGWARRAWMQWYQWAIRSRLEPVKKVARLVRRHLEGIITAIVTGAANARMEGINA